MVGQVDSQAQWREGAEVRLDLAEGGNTGWLRRERCCEYVDKRLLDVSMSRPRNLIPAMAQSPSDSSIRLFAHASGCVLGDQRIEVA